MIIDNYTKIKFKKNEKLDEEFKKKFTYPNFRMIICIRKIFSKENIKTNKLFYFTLFELIIFKFLILLKYFCKSYYYDPLEIIKAKIKEIKNRIKIKEENEENEEFNETTLKNEKKKNMKELMKQI